MNDLTRRFSSCIEGFVYHQVWLCKNDERRHMVCSSCHFYKRLYIYTLRKLCFHCLSNCIGYDRGDSFPFDFEPNGIPFGSKSERKPSPRSYTIQREKKWKYSFLSEGKNIVCCATKYESDQEAK